MGKGKFISRLVSSPFYHSRLARFEATAVTFRAFSVYSKATMPPKDKYANPELRDQIKKVCEQGRRDSASHPIDGTPGAT